MGGAALEPKKMKIKNLKNENREAVGATELAKRLGIDAAAIATLAAEGILVRAQRGRFRAKDSIRNYCGHVRAQASGRESEAVKQRRRLIAAQADFAETRAAIDAGTLLDAGEVEAEWSTTLRSVRAMMMATPSRVAARIPALSRRDTTEIDTAVRSALIEAADDTPENRRSDATASTDNNLTPQE
jgi:phage terminase Nu1 subunit (DNA packaging protein)